MVNYFYNSFFKLIQERGLKKLNDKNADTTPRRLWSIGMDAMQDFFLPHSPRAPKSL